jgi:uncharacterized membrane protein
MRYLRLGAGRHLFAITYRWDYMAFLNPLFLLGGLAAAVPILLHLIKRANARKVEFPTLMFLRRIDKKTIRYQKLRNLLLLLCRILAFLFLVFAFMRPYSESVSPSAAATAKTATTHVIVLDNSMSMSYQDRWEKAKSAAADIVRRSGALDQFALIEFSDRTEIRAELTRDRSTILSEIKNALEPGDQATRYTQALRVAEGIARKGGTDKRIIHLISDFQKTAWTNEEREFHLAAGIALQCVDLGLDEFSNLAIRNVQVIRANEGSASNLLLKASLVAFGSRNRDNVRIGLKVDGRAISEKTVRVAGGSGEEIEFPVPGLSSGEHSVVLETEDPFLVRDNSFYMTLDMRDKTPVVVVENQETRGRRSSGFFLVKALTVDRLSLYQVRTVSPQNLDFAGKLLIWNDAPVGNSAVRKRLEDFVRNGGGMIVVLGNSMVPSEFNRSFGAWLPVKMSDTSPGKRHAGARLTDGFAVMTYIQTHHPIFQPFGKPHSGTFTGARFYDYSRITANSGAEILARFDNGDPALVSIGVGKGRVLIFTSSADDSGNDLPLQAVYAPFWQQMLHYLESFDGQRNWLEIGDVIDPRKILSEKASRRGENAPDADIALAVLDPGKQRVELSAKSESVVTEKAGFYEIRTMGRNTLVAVDTHPAESDLTHLSAQDMTAVWMSSAREVFSENENPTPAEQARNQRFWIFLLLAALLCLVSELLLSNRTLKVASEDVQKVTTLNS